MRYALEVEAPTCLLKDYESHLGCFILDCILARQYGLLQAGYMCALCLFVRGRGTPLLKSS